MKMSAYVWMAVLTLSGCESVPPPVVTITPSGCLMDTSLAGTWTDARLTPLGPAWARFSFGCDCSYESRIQLLFARVVERGRYYVVDGKVHFERRAGETVWPYQVAIDRLQLSESPTETHQYQRQARSQCVGRTS
jgi:hypothetical protein